jgi:uncharacterized protein
MKCFLAILLAFPFAFYGQQGAQGPSTPESENIGKVQLEEGIPVTNQLVIDKCSGCHTKDAKGNLLRISWERSTPEGWEEAIKRMIRLRGVSLTPEEARTIVKYLSTNHGLAPEEAGPVLYYAEKRMTDETNIPNDNVRGACASCHPFARPLSWRRSASDWKLLANLHVALYPQADEAFRFGLHAGEEGGEGTVPDKTVPVDAALNFLSKSAPLQTPEWAAWRARMRAPKLAGRWLVSADVPGKGKYFGEMVVEPSGTTDDEFTTRVTLKSVKDGSVITRSGHSLVYTGYAWRGHSKGTEPTSDAPDDLGRDMREVMSVSPDQLAAQGRWFWGQYQEFGIDVKLQRASSDPTLVGVDRLSLKTGSKDNRVRIIGDNLPEQVSAADLDFGSGVTVNRVVSHTSGDMVVEVSVAADALSGKRDVAFRRAVLPKAIAVYDRVDYIRVLPESAMARLGSDHHPRGFQQFEAVGYQRGEDGKLHTADDVELGPVDVTWSVEEFIAAYGDDDKNFVGTLSPTGFFVPNSDGPNPRRLGCGDSEKLEMKRWQAAGRQVISGGQRARVHAVGPAGGGAMTATLEQTYRLGEFHPFQSAGERFLYLVPAGAIFQVDDAVEKLIACLDDAGTSHDQLIDGLVTRGLTRADAEELVAEMFHANVITTADRSAERPQSPPAVFPLQTLVMNLTNQCNLSCQYCYEFGADKVATPEGKPKFMDLATAKASVDFLLAQAEGRRSIHITFFGGETLMNFPLLKQVVEYATERAREKECHVDFSLTTNATLLTPTIIEFLSENRIGVTVSMDGPKEMHDQLRVFSNGKGSYDIIEPKVRALIENHRTRPITARVTLTAGVTDVVKIFKHLKHDLGFHEVGFAPVTTSPNQLYAINDKGMDSVLDQFHALAKEYLEYALRGEAHGFSNVSDTLAELCQGVNKSHPCGAGLGLMGVGPSGDIAPCHRFVDSDQHALGHISTGIDLQKQHDFLNRGHIDSKYDCQTCWARPLCAGGCHHEAFVRYGDTGHPNLHYCDWIRDWTNTCLEIYGAIAARNPEFLMQFAERKSS